MCMNITYSSIYAVLKLVVVNCLEIGVCSKVGLASLALWSRDYII